MAYSKRKIIIHQTSNGESPNVGKTMPLAPAMTGNGNHTHKNGDYIILYTYTENDD
jgi:hypothetical protein